MTQIPVLDQSETIIPTVGYFARPINNEWIRGISLFFEDPDPFKTYHDEGDEGDNDD